MIDLESKDQLKTGIVFVEIYSSSCSACKKQMSIIDKIEPEFSNITFTKCNSGTELGSQLCEELELMQAPSMLIYKDGVLVKQFGGLTVPNKLKDILAGV